MDTPSYAETVFINCPFDDAYQFFFKAIIFAVYRCGFSPRSAWETDDATENRIDKIIQIIGECKFGIHDLSRVEPGQSGFPRFNMPFEFGLFLGAKKYGQDLQKEKVALVLESVKYSSKAYISDIAGVDPQAHHNNVDELIRIVRNWLRDASRRKTIPSFQTVKDDFDEFINARLPIMLKENNTTFEHLTFNDYCQFVETALKTKLYQK